MRAASLLALIIFIASAAPLRAQAAAEPPRAERIRLLVLDIPPGQVGEETAATVQGLVTAGLSAYEALDVVSGEDVRRLLLLEKEKQIAGTCSDDAGCLAEIADALGAQLVVIGNVGKLDESVVVNVSLFDAKKAQGLGRVVAQSPDLAHVANRLHPKLHELITRFFTDRGLAPPALPPAPPEPPPPPPAAAVFDPGPWPWVAAGTGAALVVAGGVAMAAGGLPMLGFDELQAKVARESQGFADDGDAQHIDAARTFQADLRARATQWNTLGVFLFDGGIGAASLGVALGVGGVIVGLVATPDEAPAKERAP